MKTILLALFLALTVSMRLPAATAANFGSDLCFDAGYYLEKQPDVNRFYHGDRKAALVHWLGDGINQGREASPILNIRFYIEKYSDVPKKYREAVEHWLTVGVSEGRQGSENFDVKVYSGALKGRAPAMSYAQAMRHYLALPPKKRVAYIELSPATKAPLVPTGSSVPIKGKFYVDLDDIGTLSVNGAVVHRAGTGQSQSGEVEIKVGDRVVIQLTNAAAPRYCAVLFVASDKRQAASFATRHWKILPDPDQNDFDPAQFARTGKLAKEAKKAKAAFPFRNTSDYVWGESDVCALGCVISKEMITPLKM